MKPFIQLNYRLATAATLLFVLILTALIAFPAEVSAIPWAERQVTTLPATNITHNSATLNSQVFLGSYSYADLHFDWGNYPGILAFSTTPVRIFMPGQVPVGITGLSPSTTYYYQAVASSIIKVYGSVLSFTTTAVPTPTPTLTQTPTPTETIPAYTPRSPSGTVPGGSIGGVIISGLFPDQKTALAGSPVNITVNLVNSGGTISSNNVSLLINGVAEDSKTISLAPGSGGAVKFTVIKYEPGTYRISAGEKETELVVTAVAGPEPASSSNSRYGLILMIVGFAVLLLMAGMLIPLLKR